MKLRKRLAFITSLLLLLLSIVASSQLTLIASSVPAEEKAETVQKGWFRKGKYRYYRMKNGKLCKGKFAKIGRYYYSFDNKGRMKKGLVKLNREYSGYFSYKTGRFAYFVMDLKVTRVSENSIVGKTKKGGLYSVSLKNVKLVNEAGKKVKKSAIRKNDSTRVYFKGNILEISPAQLTEVVKVRVK